MSDFDVVTGAFSYSGRAISRALLGSGRRVRTLTGHPGRAPAGSPIEVRPLDFDDPGSLRSSLEGAGTLFNTYWIRFAHGDVTHDGAVANSRALFEAAAEASVGRIVHVSILHPSTSSPFPYFRGKAQVEQALASCGVPHSILRPSILFGGDGVLINNIAWLLRRMPVFFVGGTGEYVSGPPTLTTWLSSAWSTRQRRATIPSTPLARNGRRSWNWWSGSGTPSGRGRPSTACRGI